MFVEIFICFFFSVGCDDSPYADELSWCGKILEWNQGKLVRDSSFPNVVAMHKLEIRPKSPFFREYLASKWTITWKLTKSIGYSGLGGGGWGPGVVFPLHFVRWFLFESKLY